MELSIIIINYNTFELTCRCIASIEKTLQDVDYEIVLVDNASKERNPLDFKTKFPNINLVINKENTGFTGGNNLGIEHSKGQYLLLLNSDTELINNAPKITLDYLKSHPDTGMTTAQLTYPNGKIQHTTRRFRTISWELLEIFPIYKLLPKPKREHLMLHHYFDHQSPMDCDWVWGAYMMFNRDIIKNLPQKKLSDDFFMYCEDALWCWDFKQLGYKIHFMPNAKVMHVHRGSVSKDKWIQIKTTSIKNHALFMKKYYPDLRWYLFAVIYFSKQYTKLAIDKLLMK
jgi:GT2 family glycosyltransferase